VDDTGLPDEELLALISIQESAQAADAFVALIHRHEPALRTLFRRRGLQAEDAADLLQVVWFKLYRLLTERPGSFDPARGTFRAYLYRIAQNVATDWERSRPDRRGQPESLDEVRDRNLAAPGDIDPTSDAITHDLLEALRGRLGDEEKELLDLLLRGLTISQVCATLGVSQPTVWRRQQRLHQALKDVLGR